MEIHPVQIDTNEQISENVWFNKDSWIRVLLVPLVNPTSGQYLFKFCMFLIILYIICALIYAGSYASLPLYTILIDGQETPGILINNKPINVIYALIFGWIALIFLVALL